VTVVIEGDVVSSEVELLPPDVQTKVSALQTLDGASQAAAVTVMLSHSRTGLLAAIAAQDLPQIVEWKQKAAAIQEIAKQVRLGKDMQLDAAEFVRRAERGLGVAIREGQERGEIRKHYASRAQGQQGPLKSPMEFATKGELVGRDNGGEGIYAMTDDVSDAQFEEALTEAREEGNLSRANVARKSKAKAAQNKKESIDENDPLIDVDPWWNVGVIGAVG